MGVYTNRLPRRTLHTTAVQMPCSQRCGRPSVSCFEDPAATCPAVGLCYTETRPGKMCGAGDSRSHEIQKNQKTAGWWCLEHDFYFPIY